VRLLQVGMGGWGRYWARARIAKVPGVELVGCVDRDPRALELTTQLAGVPAERCFSSLETALAATDPEAVLVTTNLPAHVPVVRAALEAGRHVLVEKPFAPSLAEATELVDLAGERGAVLMVSQNYRFFPAVRAVVALMRSGELGALHQVDVDFRHRSTVPDPGARTGHRLLAQPLLIDMSIHHFDLMRLLIGQDATWVSCQAWNPSWSGFDGPPTAIAAIGFGDLTVSYRASWLTWGRDTPWAGEWRMTFERGEIWWSSRDLNGSEAGDRVVVLDAGGERAAPLPALPLVDQAGSLAELVAAVRDGRQPESSGRENLGSLALALAAVESSERGEPVNLSAISNPGPLSSRP
jgi:predicted dehydrogenase